MNLKTDKYEIWEYDINNWQHAVYTEDSKVSKLLKELGFEQAAVYYKKNKVVGTHHLGNKKLVGKFLDKVQTDDLNASNRPYDSLGASKC